MIGVAGLGTDRCGPAEGGRPGAEINWEPITQEFLNEPPPQVWVTKRRTFDAQGFSPLDQITPENVQKLEVAWDFDTGVTGSVQWEPKVVNDVLFVQTDCQGVLALDARTGHQLWAYEYRLLPIWTRWFRGVAGCQTSRGLAIYGDKLLAHFGDSHIVGIDASTGEEVWKTFTDGYGYSSPGIVADGVLVSGNRAKEYDRAFVTGLDPETGEILWRTYVIPSRGQPGYETWEIDGSAEMGHGSVWLSPSYDPELNLVYLGTGNPNPYTAQSRPGDNLYTNSVLAMDPQTGRIVWHHQYLPNDSWDQDMAMTPILADVEIDGEVRPVLLHTGKTGWLNVLDRRTGEFLGHTFTTYQNIILDVDAKTGRPKTDRELVPKPGKRVIACPSTRGGTSWPGRAFSPETGLYYISGNHVCMDVEGIAFRPRLVALRNIDDRFVQAPGFEHVGEIWAIDPSTLETVWTIQYDIPTTATLLPTAGGVLFAGHIDRHLYAYDPTTGEELWSHELDHQIESHPITYEIDGDQYVAVATGGGSLVGSDLVEVFAPEWSLPEGPGRIWVFRLRR